MPDGKLKRWNDVNNFALKPAIAEINQTSRLMLTATPNKIGRTVASVTIAWEEKPSKAKRAAKAELDRPEGGPRSPPQRDGRNARSRVSRGRRITYSPRWIELKRAAGCNKDNELIATDFRRFCRERGIKLDAGNIEKLFSDFCAKVGRV